MSKPTAIHIGKEPLHPLSPYLFGHNLEHTRSCVYQGLSAQLLRNRKFAGKPAQTTGQAMEWYPIGREAYFYCDGGDSYTRHVQPEKMRRSNEIQSQKIQNYRAGSPCGIGQDRLCLPAGDYEFRMVMKSAADLTVTVSVSGGGKVAASTEILCGSRDWDTFHWRFSCPAPYENASLSITFADAGELAVGAVSLLPCNHFHGMSRDVVERLREIGVSILRWPGGNFAGEYRWLDGLLPSDQRAPLRSYLETETQPHSLGADNHEIAVDDFIALCREIGAEPFLTINLAWDTPEECAQFVEYCNGTADSEWGAKRAARGYPAPYEVIHWSLGNEMGYGHMEGPNTPAAYVQAASDRGRAMLEADSRLQLYASGPYPDETWVREAAAPLGEIAPFVSLHSYAPFDIVQRMDFTTPQAALDTYQLIVGGADVNLETVRTFRKQLDQWGGGHPLRISFDEWNVWYAWYREPGVAEGIYTARMLHLFCNFGQEYGMPVCCYFEPVNEGAIVVNGMESHLTANGQVFQALARHRGGSLLPLSGGPGPLDAAATRSGSTVTLTVANSDPCSPKEFTVELEEGNAKPQGTLYSSAGIRPGTRFTESPLALEAVGGRLSFTLPEHSFCLIQFQVSD